MMKASYLLMSILLNAQLLLFYDTLPQADIIVTKHACEYDLHKKIYI